MAEVAPVVAGCDDRPRAPGARGVQEPEAADGAIVAPGREVSVKRRVVDDAEQHLGRRAIGVGEDGLRGCEIAFPGRISVGARAGEEFVGGDLLDLVFVDAGQDGAAPAGDRAIDVYE